MDWPFLSENQETETQGKFLDFHELTLYDFRNF